MWKGRVRDTVCRTGDTEELVGRTGVGVWTGMFEGSGVDIADGQPHHKCSEMTKKHRTGIGLDFSKSVLIRVLRCFDPISIPSSKSWGEEIVNRSVGCRPV